MELKFRKLRADEIDCRINTVKDTGVSLLLYKDARCDMNILDETVGPMGWQRSHSRDNANCTVSIWDKDNAFWVSKEDTGTESYTEKAKGQASDSFKRACFNWGIGRELYTAPFIWIANGNGCTIKKWNSKLTCYDAFSVGTIDYDDKGRISALTILDSHGKCVYTLGQKPPERKLIAPGTLQKLCQEIERTGYDEKRVLYTYKVRSLDKMTEADGQDALLKFSNISSLPDVPEDNTGLPFA